MHRAAGTGRMTRLLGRIALGVAAICLAATTTTSWAEVTLSTVLSDHMVLQRERPIHLWGTADPAEKVTVAFKGNWATTEADSFGRWSVYLPGSPAGGPFPLVVEAKNTIRFDDVLVGDIWVASGQSNMEFPMKQTPPWSSAIRNMQRELAGASHPRIRLFHVQKTASDFPRVNPDAGPWSVCTPENVANFSAVAYFFAVEIEQKQHVPIGVIEASWGGTPAEAWTSLDALSADASLMPVFRYRAHMMEDEPTTLLKLQMMQAEVDRQVALGKAASMPWHLDPNAWAPAALFNGMIAPITPFPIRGVIWYQGESNTNPEQVPIYAHLFQSLIQDWRAKWKIGDFPFLFAQIANYRYGEEWPAIREAERRSLALTNTGMAVTIDIGDAENIHPPDK